MSDVVEIPIWRSLLDADALAAWLRRVYGLPPIRVRLQQQGVNDTWRIDAGRSVWYARLTPVGHRGFAELAAEADLLGSIAATGLEVVRPLGARDGSLVQRVGCPEGERLLMLFPAAPGAVGGDFDADRYRALGHLAGRLHRLADQRIPIGSDVLARRPVWDLEALLDRPLEAILGQEGSERHLGLIRRCADGCREAIGVLPRSSPGYGFIHGDLHSGNAALDSCNVVTLFDFDLCGSGWRLYDLAVFFYTRRHVHDLESDRLLAWKHFLDGYRVFRKVEQEDIDLLPWFVMLRHFWQAHHALQRAKERPAASIDDLVGRLARRLMRLAGRYRLHDTVV